MIRPKGEAAVPTGTYWDQPTWDLARSAYIADLDADPDAPDAFVGWLQRALHDHAARTPEQRAQMAVRASTTAGGRGLARPTPSKPKPSTASSRPSLTTDRH